MRKVIAVIFILFLLVGLAYAGDAKKEDKEVLKDGDVVDKTKETLKEVEKGISVRDTSADISKYDVKTEKNKITISKADTVKDKKVEHTKTKLVMDEKTAKSIDIDNDGKFGYLRIVDGQVVESKVVTLAELTTGIDATFSDVIINGLTGTRTTNFIGVTSGQTLNIQDSSPDAVTVAVSGAVPEYVAGIPTDGLWAHYNFNINANDSSGNENHGTPSNVLYVNGGALFNGSAVITVPDTNFNDSFTVLVDVDPLPPASGKYTIFSQGKPEFAAPYNGFWITTNSFTVSDSNTAGVVGTNIYDANRNTWTYRYTGTNITIYKGLSTLSTKSTASVPYMGDMLNNAKIGKHSALDINYMNGTIYDLIVYETPLNLEKITHAYAGGSGISFQPEPSYNFTGYNVGSGVAKTLGIDSTVTGIEVVNTAGTTNNYTVVEYFTNDITEITDSHTALLQTVNITHTATGTMDNATVIPYSILDGYDGTAVLSSNNTNATISRNETAFVISTGYLAANSTYYYNVQIPNPVEEMLWYDWNPDNETCNAKVQIVNSTSYTTWNITTFNVTNGSLYKLVYAGNGTEVGNATAVNGSASIIIVELVDGVYWLTETSVLTGFVNVPAVAVVIIGAAGAFVGGSFINKWYRRRRGS